MLAAARRGEGIQLFGDDYPTPDGTCIRDYIHVSDLARAHLLALDATAPGRHAIYNLGSGTGYSNLEVLGACREVTGLDIPAQVAPRRPGDPAVLVASSEAIAADLGWRAELDLHAMVADAWTFAQLTAQVAGIGAVSAIGGRGSGGPLVRRGLRRGAGRRLARPRPGQPDRGAHRLQRRLRAPVRPRSGGARRGVPA